MVSSYISVASCQTHELRFCVTFILAMKVRLLFIGQNPSNLVLFLVQELPAQPTHQLPAPDAYLKINPTAKEVGKLKDWWGKVQASHGIQRLQRLGGCKDFVPIVWQGLVWLWLWMNGFTNASHVGLRSAMSRWSSGWSNFHQSSHRNISYMIWHIWLLDLKWQMSNARHISSTV